MNKQELFQDSRMAFLCRSLARQLHAGVSLAEGLYLLAEDETGAAKELYHDLGCGMDAGKQLSEALEEAGFEQYLCGMVAVGEKTGRLERTLEALGSFYEQRNRTRRQIKNALSYPAMVFGLMLVVITVLLIKVLPIFDDVYASLGSSMTGIAGGLLALGRGLEKALPVLLLLLAGVLMAVILYRNCYGFRIRMNRWYQSRFGDSGIGRKFNNAHFAQAVAIGISSGLPLEEAMKMGADLLKEIPGASLRCESCIRDLEAGMPLHQALAAHDLLPPAESRLLAVGIRGGNADAVMEEIAQRLSCQAEEALEDTVSGIEPGMVLAASGLVGLILLAVMLPLMDILSSIG